MLHVFYSDTGEKRAAHSLLSHAYREIFAAPCPEVAYEKSGRPYFPSRPDVFFSLSHARRHVMAALGSAPVGCDAEDDRAITPTLVDYVCSPEELERFDFFELWTLKESYLKLHGTLPYLFCRARFTRSPSGAILTPDPGLHSALWRLENCQFAVISEEEPPKEMLFVPSNLL